MKTFIKFFCVFIFVCFFGKSSLSNDKIKIGLIVPLSGEYAQIGKSILNATRLALNSIDDERFEVLPRNTKSDPKIALKVSKELYYNDGVKIIIGPVFNKNNILLNQLPEVTFLSFTNKLINNHSNVISSGVNAVSQILAIKKFQKKNGLKNTIFLIPDEHFKDEVENAILETKIKLKNTHIYNTDPTLLTAQIEKITKYKIRKQNLLDEIERIKNLDLDDESKEKRIINLEKRDTIGNINFDSVIISDFDENLKSVATSLLYTDVSSNRVKYISLNQWFDETLLKEISLQPMYFPSINQENYNIFIDNYKKKFGEEPNQISFLSYDLLGLVYYLIFKNNFVVDNKIFYEKNKFLGKIGIFEINKNKITHELSFYSADKGKFIKIF